MPVFSSPDQMSNAKRNEMRNCLNFKLANKSKKICTASSFSSNKSRPKHRTSRNEDLLVFVSNLFRKLQIPKSITRYSMEPRFLIQSAEETSTIIADLFSTKL